MIKIYETIGNGFCIETDGVQSFYEGELPAEYAVCKKFLGDGIIVSWGSKGFTVTHDCYSGMNTFEGRNCKSHSLHNFDGSLWSLENNT